MSQAGSEQVLALGNCLFDRSRGLLLRNDEPVPLRPKAFALLAHLAANSGRVVGKSDLIAAVWPGIFVTEDSLTQAIRELRKALADDEQQTVRTIARRGYLLSPTDLTTPVHEGQPVVAILRFTNEGDESQEPLVDGFTEDVMNGLARFRTAIVLARNSSFAFRSESDLDWRAVGKELGANFLVRGRMRLAADALQARVSMVDAVNGAVLWNDAFSAAGAAIFDVLDEIAQRIVNRLVARLEDAGLKVAHPIPPGDLAAHQLLLRGIVRLRGYRDEDNQAARGLFAAAVEKDPQYALAHAYVALADLIVAGYGEAPPDVLAAAVDQAQFAATLAPEEPRCQRILGVTRLFAREHEAAEYHMRRSLDLNPYDADTMSGMGYLLTMRGRPVEALAWLDRAIRINPIHPEWYDYDRSMALYSAGDYRGSIACLSKLPTKMPWRLMRLAACHVQLGNLDEARRFITDMRKLAPNYAPMDFVRRGIVFEHQSDIEHLAEAVAKAMAA